MTSINGESTQKVPQNPEAEKMLKAIERSNPGLNLASETSKRRKPPEICTISRIEETKKKVLSILGPTSKVDEPGQAFSII